MNNIRNIFIIGCALALTGCGGSAGSDSSSPPSAVTNVSSGSSTTLTRVTGNITYDRVPHAADASLDYNRTIRQPVRGAVIEAVNAQGQVLATTRTDEAGDYGFDIDVNTSIRVQVKAQLLSDEGQQKWDLKVTDNTQSNSLYVLQGSLLDTGQNARQVRDLHAPHGWDGQSYSDPRAAAPFAILDSVYLAVKAIGEIDETVEFPPLEIRWSPNNRTLTGQRALGHIGTSSFVVSKEDVDAIYLLGEADRDTDEYDPHVILHEWAHYFEHALSRRDSLGGLHSLQDRLDPRVAFSEGWGNAFAGNVTGDPIYKDSSGTGQSKGFLFNLETLESQNRGWYNEASVSAVLYDIIDDAADAGDTVSGGLSAIYNVMRSDDYINAPVFATIFSVADGLRKDMPEQETDLDNLLALHGISGRGANGVGEKNAGAIRSALPVYKQAEVNGGTVNLCSVDDAGIHNKLGNREFIFLDLDVAQELTLTLTKTLGDDRRDPDFNIWRGTELLHKSASSGAGEEEFQGRLESGRYIIEAFDFYNINGSGSRRSDSCYDLRVAG